VVVVIENFALVHTMNLFSCVEEKNTGRAFAEAGVPHVVAVPLDQKKSISERTPVKRFDIEVERDWLNRTFTESRRKFKVKFDCARSETFVKDITKRM
jgi:hypothetical protein